MTPTTTLGQLIHDYRARHSLSMEEFAARAGLSKGYVSMLERNLNPATQGAITPSLSTIRKAAAAMGLPFEEVLSALGLSSPSGARQEVTDEQLFSLENVMPLPEMKKIPLLGEIACGEPILAQENVEELLEIPKSIHADFALTCRGDSMTGARIMDGDIVYIRIQPDVENGEIAAVLIDGEATLKRVYKYPNMLVLRPENPAYEEFVYQDEELEQVRILGRAVSFTSAVR